MPHRQHTQFAIVPAIVGKIERVAQKNFRGVFEIEPTFRKRGGTLDRIERESSFNYCIYK